MIACHTGVVKAKGKRKHVWEAKTKEQNLRLSQRHVVLGAYNKACTRPYF